MRFLGVIAAAVLAYAGPLAAQTTRSGPATSPAPGQVAISTSIEGKKKQLVATVTDGDKKVEDAIVIFYAKRTFGNLKLGQDKTLDDGTGAVSFPADLPGDDKGNLTIIVDVPATPKFGGAHGEVVLPGGEPLRPPPLSFPRALWAPQAPLILIASIAVLIAVVWFTYAFVVVQIVRIRKGATA